MRFGGLTAVLVTVLRAEPAEWDGAIAVLWVSAGVSVVGALLWSFGRLRSTEVRIGLVAMLVAFGVMIALAPSSAASVMGGTVAYSAAFDLQMRDSAQIVAAGSLALAIAVLALGDSRRLLLLLVFALMWWAGLSHQQYLKRAEQAELLLTETRRAADASSMAATLAERADRTRDPRHPRAFVVRIVDSLGGGRRSARRSSSCAVRSVAAQGDRGNRDSPKTA